MSQAVKELIEEGRLNVNIAFMFEGEEEAVRASLHGRGATFRPNIGGGRTNNSV